MAADTASTASTWPAVASPPWWRFGMVWFVFAGPALVVVAGFATMAIAFIGADAEIHAPTAVSAFSIRIGAENRLPLAASAKSANAAPKPTAAAPN